MLTEFELEMREEPEKGLWLTANWHQVRDDWRARRARGPGYRPRAGPVAGASCWPRRPSWGEPAASCSTATRRSPGCGASCATRAAIGACYREHVGPPSKPLKSQIRDLQRALGRAEVPGVPDELARLLAQEKEEGADEGARKVKEDWGDVDEEAW